ncbi:MAG: hypothetical protein DMG80_02125 [Acidobacteria bacterium]|nr:MAG: hypothetical protein DMG80_02125 [Acidobacteriota bacterium]
MALIMNLRKLHLGGAILLAMQIAFSTTIAGASDKQSEGMDLIKHAIDLTDLQHSGPYHLRWNLTVLDEALRNREGTDEVTFSSTERWRRDLHMTGYDEVAVFLGHNMYRTRSMAFTPPSVRADYAGSLRNVPEALTFKVVRVFNRKKDNVEARCVELQAHSYAPGGPTWCFDSRTGLPSEELGARGYRREFLNYKSLGSKFVPGEIEIIAGRKQRAKVVLEAADSAVADPVHGFDPPAGATVRPWCDDMALPSPIILPPMDIRPDFRSRKGLELKYELTIDAQGRVTNIVPMDPKPYVDRIAIESLRNSQWNPAMCSGTPVPTDTIFDVGRPDR